MTSAPLWTRKHVFGASMHEELDCLVNKNPLICKLSYLFTSYFKLRLCKHFHTFKLTDYHIKI